MDGKIVYNNIIKKINSDLGLNFDKKLFDVNSPNYELYVKKYSQWVEKNFEYLTNITNANALKTKTNNNLQYAYNGGFQLRSTFWNYYWYIPSWHRKDLWEKSTGDPELVNDLDSIEDYALWKIVQFALTKLLPIVAKKFAKFSLKLSIPGAGIACLTQCATVWIAASIAGRAGVVCRIFSPAISPPVFTGSWPFEEDSWD
ncbi:MAG: hypothetical protein E7Y34_02140 [Mycoplasma sp.]|nr:hypothetical protein [Mycoplasma sp.]